MKLYLCNSGILTATEAFFVEGKGPSPVKAPMPFYLIRHEGKNILFDVGNPASVIQGVTYPDGTTSMIMDESEWAPNTVKALDIDPGDIDIIMVSHLHPDHAGALAFFPNATVLIRQAEYEIPTRYVEIPEDIQWQIIYGEEDYDVFGDGRLILIFTPGHTAGHQSLRVTLDDETVFLLAADACYVRENLSNHVTPTILDPAADPDAYRHNLENFSILEQQGVIILPGHDMDEWNKFRHAPEYY